MSNAQTHQDFQEQMDQDIYRLAGDEIKTKALDRSPRFLGKISLIDAYTPILIAVFSNLIDCLSKIEHA